MPSINKDWVDQLAESAGGPQGLVVTGEDGELDERPGRLGPMTGSIPAMTPPRA